MSLIEEAKWNLLNSQGPETWLHQRQKEIHFILPGKPNLPTLKTETCSLIQMEGHRLQKGMALQPTRKEKWFYPITLCQVTLHHGITGDTW